MKKRTALTVLAVGIFCCTVMALVDGVIQPGYAVKSCIKAALFLLLPLLTSLWDRDILYLPLFRPRTKGALAALGLGAALYSLILGAYFLIGPYFDFSGIAKSLTGDAGITKDNFLYVSLYISFVNSFLEEFFFRGFLFSNLRTSAGRKTAYLFSSLLFSLYHTAMMIGWFSLPLFLLVLAGLAAGGMIFNWLNEKMDTIYCSWLTHMFANFAINTIGFLLLK